MKLLEEVGKGISVPALDRSLAELWSKLRITRVDYSESEGASWDVLQRWSSEAVSEGVNCSAGEALSAVLSKVLGCVGGRRHPGCGMFFWRVCGRLEKRG